MNIETITETHGWQTVELNDHYLSVLKLHPQNEWFMPTNKENEAHKICCWFASRGIICKKQIPLFTSGAYRGMADYFLWNYELKYSLKL